MNKSSATVLHTSSIDTQASFAYFPSFSVTKTLFNRQRSVYVHLMGKESDGSCNKPFYLQGTFSTDHEI